MTFRGSTSTHSEVCLIIVWIMILSKFNINQITIVSFTLLICQCVWKWWWWERVVMIGYRTIQNVEVSVIQTLLAKQRRGGEDWKMGKLPRHHVYGPFCLHFFIPVYKHTLNSCFYQRKTLLLFSTLHSKLFMAISTLSLREWQVLSLKVYKLFQKSNDHNLDLEQTITSVEINMFMPKVK